MLCMKLCDFLGYWYLHVTSAYIIYQNEATDQFEPKHSKSHDSHLIL